MKKVFALLLAALMVVSLAACSKEKTEEKKDAKEPEESKVAESTEAEPPVSGGWTDAASPVITDEIKAMVAKANEVLTGAQYTPVALLGTQVVAGTNYLILCKCTPTVPDAVSTYVLTTFYQDLEGKVEITETKDCTASVPEAYDPENPVSGGWGETTSPEVTDEAKTALSKACETLTGASYEAKALLATQIVAGTNYSILCKVTPTVPDAESTYAIVTVYADLEGGAEITAVEEFKTADQGAEESTAVAADAQAEDSQAE